MPEGKHKRYLKDEFKSFWSSFTLSRNFLYTGLLEIGLIISLLLTYLLLSKRLNALSSRILNISHALENTPLADIGGMIAVESDLKGFYTTMIVYTIIFAIIVLLLWTAFKYLIYCSLNKQSLGWKSYLKFLLASVIWLSVTVLIVFLIQLGLFYLVNTTLRVSIMSQVTLIGVSILTLLAMFYLTIAFLTPLVLTGRLKTAFSALYMVGIRKIRYAIVPILLGIILFIVANLLLFVFVRLPEKGFLLCTTLLLLAFFIWVRIYFTDVWRRIGGEEYCQKAGLKKEGHNHAGSAKKNTDHKHPIHKIRHRVTHRIKHMMIRKKNK
ncbi:MAG: hypothetical protein V1729_05815 [Candidatus Woesearchaeota archaeon]